MEARITRKGQQVSPAVLPLPHSAGTEKRQDKHNITYKKGSKHWKTQTNVTINTLPQMFNHDVTCSAHCFLFSLTLCSTPPGVNGSLFPVSSVPPYLQL